MDTKITAKKVIGTKQTIKAIKSDNAKIVYVARDAEAKVINPIIELCQQRDIELVYYNSMLELGKACSIDVSAATACVIKEQEDSIKL